MLIIRQAQIDTLDEASRERFLGVLEQHLRTHASELMRPYDSAALREFNTRVWALAVTYGLASEHGVCSYLNSVLIFGEGFESRQDAVWAKRILEDEDLSEVVKIERLRDGTETILKRRAREENR